MHRCTYFVVVLDAPDDVWNPIMIGVPEIAKEFGRTPGKRIRERVGRRRDRSDFVMQRDR